MDARALAVHAGSDEGWAVLCPDGPPAFSGGARPAVDWRCAACGSVLLQHVYERQFLDVLLRCPNCTSLNASPERMPGEPIPRTTVLVPPGRYRLSSAVLLQDKPVLVAEAAK